MTLSSIILSVPNAEGRYELLSRAGFLFRERGGRYYAGEVTNEENELLNSNSRVWYDSFIMRGRLL